MAGRPHHPPISGTGDDCPAWTDDLTACPTGRELLRRFRETRPDDYAFLDARDLIDLRSPAFEGISEWDAFVEHYAICKSCQCNVAESGES